MEKYKHTQISFLMIFVTIVILAFFVGLQITARNEAPSVDSGANFAITALMVIILFVIASFSTLSVSVDQRFIKLRFGLGFLRKKFLLDEIASIRRVKNRWYYGWGIRFWFKPKMWIFNVSGFDAIELTMKNGKIYRIGTDEPEKLETSLLNFIRKE